MRPAATSTRVLLPPHRPKIQITFERTSSGPLRTADPDTLSGCERRPRRPTSPPRRSSGPQGGVQAGRSIKPRWDRPQPRLDRVLPASVTAGST
jgi:hypothetical protein